MKRRDDRIGESNYNKHKELMTIIDYQSRKDITVQFEDGSVKHTSYSHFLNGEVRKPIDISERLGATNYNNSQKCLMTVIDYKDFSNITVEFDDEYKTTKRTTWIAFKNGQVLNPNMKLHIKNNIFEKQGNYWIGYLKDGNYFKFSDEDYDWISKNYWMEITGGYIGNGDKERLHKLILIKKCGYDYTKKGLVGDHINRDRKDNRRENLRIVTPGQNSKNQESYENGGVSFNKNANKWMAYINENHKHYHLGYFDTEEEARKIRNETMINIKNNVLPSLSKPYDKTRYTYKNKVYNLTQLCRIFNLKTDAVRYQIKKGHDISELFSDEVHIV